MLKSNLFAALFLTTAAAFAGGLSDPDFEKSPAGELPKWNGGSWIKMSTPEFTAKVVEDPAHAFSGKKYLHMENAAPTPVTVGGFPRFTCRSGKKYTLQCKAKGTGQLNIMFIRNDKNMKNRPWTNKAEAKRLQLVPEKWQELKFSFVPAPEDHKMCVALSLRSGSADVDQVAVTIEDDTVKK